MLENKIESSINGAGQIGCPDVSLCTETNSK